MTTFSVRFLGCKVSHNDAQDVRERLLGMVADYQADELIVVTITHDFKARLRSYELLAEVFGLPDRWSGHPLPEASA